MARLEIGLDRNASIVLLRISAARSFTVRASEKFRLPQFPRVIFLQSGREHV